MAMTTPITLDQLIERLNDVRVFAGGYDASHEATIVMAVAALEKWRRPIELIGRVEIEKRNLADEVERLAAERARVCAAIGIPETDDPVEAIDHAKEVLRGLFEEDPTEGDGSLGRLVDEVRQAARDLGQCVEAAAMVLGVGVDDLVERVEADKTEREGLDRRCQEHANRIAALAAERDALRVEVEEWRAWSRPWVGEHPTPMVALNRHLATVKREHEKATSERDALVSEVDALRARAERAEAESKRLQSAAEVMGEALTADRAALANEADRLRARVAELEKAIDIMRVDRDAALRDAEEHRCMAALRAAPERVDTARADELARWAASLESSLSHAAESFGINGVPFAEMPAVMARKYAEMSAEATELVRERDEARRKLALHEPCSTCRGERDLAQDCLRQVGALVSSVPESLHTEDGRTAILVAVGDVVSQRDGLRSRIANLEAAVGSLEKQADRCSKITDALIDAAEVFGLGGVQVADLPARMSSVHESLKKEARLIARRLDTAVGAVEDSTSYWRSAAQIFHNSLWALLDDHAPKFDGADDGR